MSRLPCFQIVIAFITVYLVPSPGNGAIVDYVNAVMADGAVAYYQFDETTGTTAFDTATEAGGANDGTQFGGVYMDQPSGREGLGKAYAFDGTGRVQVPHHDIFDVGAGTFSVEFWFQASSFSRGDMWTYKDANCDFGVQSNAPASGPPGGWVGVYFRAPTGSYESFALPEGGTSNAIASAFGLWHHLVLTRDSSGIVSLYLDAALRGTVFDNDSLTSVNGLLFGANHNGTPDDPALLFAGLLDEMAFYNVALSAEQIANHYELAALPEPGSTALLLWIAGSLACYCRRRPCSLR